MGGGVGMARIRTIKPEFFRHEGLYELERECCLPIRVAFAGLWTAADREGRFRWAPRTLKLDCLPFDECDFSRVLDALATRGFIVKYSCDGVDYGFIPSWSKNQVINNRESESDLPDPKKCPIESITSTREPRVSNATATPLMHAQVEGKGKEGEGKGKEGEAPRKRSATPDIAKPDDVAGQTWADWLALRKAKKAPVTETVLNSARLESIKAAMPLEAFLQVWCARGSQGLQADWIRPDERSPVRASETPYQRSMRERMQEAAPEFARKDPSRTSENVVDFFAIEVPAKRLEIGNEPSAALG